MKSVLFGLLIICAHAAWAQSCPGADDEPAMKIKTTAGPTLVVCGFEDHDSPAPKGSLAFSDFTVYASGGGIKQDTKIFASEPSETYWVKSDSKGLQLEQLWFFSDKPQPALRRRVDCTAESCALSSATCILKLKRNPYPKALARFKKGALGDDGEDILDQIWAQALAGDAAAVKFYASKPADLEPGLSEVFDTNQKKLQDAKELKCQLGR
jgi:hypothetical protein